MYIYDGDRRCVVSSRPDVTRIIIITIIITSVPRPAAWLSSQTASSRTAVWGPSPAASEQTNTHCTLGSAIRLSTATLSSVCQLDASRCDPEERNSRRSPPPTVANQRGRCRPARRVIDPHRVGSLWPPARLTDTDAAATAAADVNVIDEDFNEPDPRPG